MIDILSLIIWIIHMLSRHLMYSPTRIPVTTISNTVANREAIVSNYLDPDEAQAFALADAHDGRLLIDDGDAQSFTKDQGVTVVGSVGVLLVAFDAGKIDEALLTSGCRRGWIKSATMFRIEQSPNIDDCTLFRVQN